MADTEYDKKILNTFCTYLQSILACEPAPTSPGAPCEHTPALHAVLFLQLRGGHLVDIPPLLELLPRQQVDGSATVFPAAAKTIPAEPLLNEVDQ